MKPDRVPVRICRNARVAVPEEDAVLRGVSRLLPFLGAATLAVAVMIALVSPSRGDEQTGSCCEATQSNADGRGGAAGRAACPDWLSARESIA